jgi:hypothetical protein
MPSAVRTEVSGYGLGAESRTCPGRALPRRQLFALRGLIIDSACLHFRGRGRFPLGLCLSYLHSKMPPGEPTQQLASYAPEGRL